MSSHNRMNLGGCGGRKPTVPQPGLADQIPAVGPVEQDVLRLESDLLYFPIREAPVVLTCSAPVGHRQPGCRGGLLRILGRAPFDAPAVVEQHSTAGVIDADSLALISHFSKPIS